MSKYEQGFFLSHYPLSNMKNIKLISVIAILFAITTFVMMSCEPDHDELRYEESDIYGKWKEGTDYQVYNSDYTGATWDTADDVIEAEAQQFTWSLSRDTLVHIHMIEMVEPGSRAIPKVYQVIELTAEHLSYIDDYGKTHNFIKVIEEPK